MYDRKTTVRKPKYRLADYKKALEEIRHRFDPSRPRFVGGFCMYLSLSYSDDSSLRRYPEIWKHRPARQNMYTSGPGGNRSFWFPATALGAKTRIKILKEAIADLEVKITSRIRVGDSVSLNPALGYSEKQCSIVFKVDEVFQNILTVSARPGTCMTKDRKHFIKK